MSHATNLGAIKEAYTLVDDQFDRIYAQCTTAAQKQQARDLRDGLRDAYWRAMASNLADETDLVNSIRKDLQDANDRIEADLKSLKNIVAFLQLVTEGLKLACALAVLAAAV
jgi:hypothetical protein